MPGISQGNPDAWGRDLPSGVSFLTSLNHATLLEARRCVRRVFERMNPGGDLSWLTDRECDRIIEAWGPDALEEARHNDADRQRLDGLSEKIRRRRARVNVSMLPAQQGRMAARTSPAPSTPRLVLSTSVRAALKERS